MKNSSDTIENRTHDLPTCSAVPQPTALLRAQKNISTEYFKHAAHSPFFCSKCRLFHNATFFGSRIIYILHRGCAKI